MTVEAARNLICTTNPKPFWTDKSDETIVDFYIVGAELVVATYDRRSTRQTWEVRLLPKSLS